jgi:hypothetical protein
LKEEKKRLRGHPDDQQESRSSHCEHYYERPEMMIVRLPAQWVFFFHTNKLYNPETNVQSSPPTQK